MFMDKIFSHGINGVLFKKKEAYVMRIISTFPCRDLVIHLHNGVIVACLLAEGFVFYLLQVQNTLLSALQREELVKIHLAPLSALKH